MMPKTVRGRKILTWSVVLWVSFLVLVGGYKVVLGGMTSVEAGFIGGVVALANGVMAWYQK